jgi:carbamoyl-phosphate synthase large subunit
MVDVASRVMLGTPLASLGYGTGLYPAPPTVAVKVPVFSFEKLTDANAYLGPEMKSTGEVLGVGRTVEEALFKGLTAAGLSADIHSAGQRGALVSVDTHDQWEILPTARMLDGLGFTVYATEETAATIAGDGIPVKPVSGIRESDNVFRLMDEGKIGVIVYTGALLDSTVDDYIALHRHALLHRIPCFTSLDTANAFLGIAAGRFTEENTELVDINRLQEKA